MGLTVKAAIRLYTPDPREERTEPALEVISKWSSEHVAIDRQIDRQIDRPVGIRFVFPAKKRALVERLVIY